MSQVKYTPEIAMEIKFWLSKGYSLREILGCMLIHLSTIDRWRKKYPELQKAIQSGLHRQKKLLSISNRRINK